MEPSSPWEGEITFGAPGIWNSTPPQTTHQTCKKNTHQNRGGRVNSIQTIPYPTKQDLANYTIYNFPQFSGGKLSHAPTCGGEITPDGARTHVTIKRPATCRNGPIFTLSQNGYGARWALKSPSTLIFNQILQPCTIEYEIHQIKKWVYTNSPNICVNKFMSLIRCTQITCDTFYPIEMVIVTSENLQKCHKIQFPPSGKKFFHTPIFS